MRNPAVCKHDELEQLTDETSWCPECASLFAATREQIDCVYILFIKKLTERHPEHPWATMQPREVQREGGE